MSTTAQLAVDLGHLDLDAAVADLIEHAEQAVADGDVEELAKLHVLCDDLRRRVTDVARNVEEALVDAMPDKTLELPGLPVIERRRGNNRTKWDSDALFSTLMRGAIADPETGELISDPVALISNIEAEVKACVPLTGSLGWRVTALRDRDIDPDEFCTTSPGRVTAQIHKETEHL